MIRTLILSFLMFFTISSSGQDYCKYNTLKHKKAKSTKHKIEFNNLGVFIVVHGTDIAAPDLIFPKSTNGTILNGGLGFSYKKQFSKNDFFKIELSYLQKGSYYQFNSGSGRKIFRLNYFEIPLLWSHNLFNIEETIMLETGIAISYLFFSNNQIAIYAANISEPQAQNFKSFDFPWIINLKAPLTFNGKKNLEIGLRFSYSFMSIHKFYKTESIRNGNDGGMHHMTYGVQLEHKF